MKIDKSDKNEVKSSAHSKYRCQYHIVFVPRYRRKKSTERSKEKSAEYLPVHGFDLDMLLP